MHVVELLAEVGDLVQLKGAALCEVGVEVQGGVEIGVARHTDVTQLTVVDNGRIVGLVVAPLGLETQE